MMEQILATWHFDRSRQQSEGAPAATWPSQPLRPKWLGQCCRHAKTIVLYEVDLDFHVLPVSEKAWGGTSRITLLALNVGSRLLIAHRSDLRVFRRFQQPALPVLPQSSQNGKYVP